ncbi:superinfection immunity protein [Mycobacterium sp. 94-17]|uniref:superinfection immunity protein n=1 Tax=Mycobacterium sp. 94-17 TaxID=2986147 RepID=UPI002D1E5E95|nr:superinfection immunity protein [Mycobacterium sp. 94-17]MEB4212334.1 superinfection immunity protein [Mycobacterium sp. 94-17]
MSVERAVAIVGWVLVVLAAAWAVFLYKAIFFSDSGDISAPRVFVFVALTALGLGLYFLPTGVAAYRQIPNIGPVVVINVFLGWTFLGWVAALAMSVAGRTGTD